MVPTIAFWDVFCAQAPKAVETTSQIQNKNM